MMIDFGKSFHPEFGGWITEKGKGVFISMIYALHPGRGDFSKLLLELKKKYAWIKVPTASDQMEKILAKKGFVKKVEWFPLPFCEYGEVWVWKNK